jgi:uncharacterized protein YcaQ
MTESLSIHEARKLVLLSQRVPPARPAGRAIAATLSAIEHLGYVQIDTISVIQRAHHHTLWNRNPRYQPAQLDQLIAGRRVFEYWSHAAAYLPMTDYRFSLPRKQAFARGEQEHWYERDARLEKLVLKRIASEGPLKAKDFEYTGKRSGEWKTKPAKRALENLFMRGDLMSPGRVGFQKLYDLTDRVLPEGTKTDMPDSEEHARFLITRFLRANGLGRPAEIAYLLPDTQRLVARVMREMVASGELTQIRVGTELYHSLPASLELLKKPLARGRLKILSPFDNLLIQRQRMRALFGFDYLIECYLPAAKRRYGYFSLPVLWGGKFAARMDCKAVRKESRLDIHHLALEPWLVKTDAFFQALRGELELFMRFNCCDSLRLLQTSPEEVNPPWRIVNNGDALQKE